MLATLPMGPDKRPRCAGGCYGASSDPEAIKRLFANAPGSGLAVATGAASGIDVLDVDPRNGGDQWLATNAPLIPKTRVHRTPRGGWHIVLRHVEGMRCPGALRGSGVDVKGDGGYVGWPPTTGYRVARDVEVADWTDGLLALVRSGPSGSVHPSPFKIATLRDTLAQYPKTVERWSKEDSYAFTSKNNQYNLLSRTREGSRGSALYRSAAGLGQQVAVGWMSAWEAVQVLWMACEANGLVAKDGRDRVLRELFRGLQAGIRTPRAPLADPYESEGGRFLQGRSLTELLKD
jgi:hypothetical protein